MRPEQLHLAALALHRLLELGDPSLERLDAVGAGLFALLSAEVTPGHQGEKNGQAEDGR